MKRIDKAMLEGDQAENFYREYCCPVEYGSKIDPETETQDDDGLTTGCRGITCVACWDKEVD